ncbi:MAG: hypothetical protein AB8B94_16705 [Hyphomicrobiales bacterium]
MNTTLSILDRLANWRGFTILIILYVAVFGTIIATLSKLTTLTGGIGILDFDRGYSVERVRKVFDSYGAEGFALYGRIQLLDIFNPAIYSLIFACLIYLLWKNKGYRWVVAPPLAAGLLDYCENLTLFLLSRSYPEISPQLVTISSTLSLIKNVALFGTIIVLLIGLFIWFRERFKSKT